MTPFGWGSIARLGLVQMALGAIVVLTTSTLNRVMVVELALPALLPGMLVALHYLVQIARPRMGHGSDVGGRRTPWIVGGMAALWAVPGPVWVALTARALSGGFASAWPMAVGVALGDLIWPMAAIFGLTWILSVYGEFLHLLRWFAALVFAVMGILLIRKPAVAPTTDSRMTRPGMMAGFVVGIAAVIGNPKAILFLIGTEMDFVRDKLQARFVFNNPNATRTCGCGESFAV